MLFMFIQVFYIHTTSPHHTICVNVSPQNTFRTPVYTTSDRRNAMGIGLVFEADLATEEHISHWVLQGVCLVLNTD